MANSLANVKNKKCATELIYAWGGGNTLTEAEDG
jgi:hypothetical protein